MCTNEYKKYLSCGHVVVTEYKCPTFNKRKNKSSTREQCPNFKRMDMEDPYKCNNFGEEYCVKPPKVKQKPEAKDIPMAMDEREAEKPSTKEPAKGGLLNPKGTRMAWETSDDELSGVAAAVDSMQIDSAGKMEKKDEKIGSKKVDKPMAWEVEEAKAGSSEAEPLKAKKGRSRRPRK